MAQVTRSQLLIGFLSCLATGTTLSQGVAPRQFLNDGNSIPTLGLGTFLGFSKKRLPLKPKENEVVRAVEAAIDAGYRLIDTAQVYGTEEQLGKGVRNKIADGTVTRGDVFISTKLWNDKHAREDVVPALRESLRKMGLTYVDLYLMHWPMALTKDYKVQLIDYLDTWKGMEDAKKLGLAKSIGISNFNEQQIERLFAYAEIKPAVLQVEVNPYLSQYDLVAYAQSKGLAITVYAPFGSLKASRDGSDAPSSIADEPAVAATAGRHGKTPRQVLLRYLLDRGLIPIAKSTSPTSIRENVGVFDFALAREERATLDRLDRGQRVIRPVFWQHHPDYPFDRVDAASVMLPPL